MSVVSNSYHQVHYYFIIRSLKGDEKAEKKFTTDDEISMIIFITVISIKIFYISEKKNDRMWMNGSNGADIILQPMYRQTNHRNWIYWS